MNVKMKHRDTKEREVPMNTSAARTTVGRIAIALMVGTVVVIAYPAPVSAQSDPSGVPTSLSADELLDRSDETLFPESFVATYRMETVRPGRRTAGIVLESSHLEGAGTYMEVSEPARSRGMRFLQKEEDLWMYNPRSGSRRALRLAPRDSFQGSVFSNNDVSDPDFVDDYRARRAGNRDLDHPEMGLVTTTILEAEAAHDEAPYGRLVMWLWGGPDGGNVLPLRIDYYSKSGLAFKRMTLFEFGERAGGYRPAFLRMESLEEEGVATTVRIDDLEARETLPARLFNQAELTR